MSIIMEIYLAKKELKAEKLENVEHFVEGVNRSTLLKVNQNSIKYDYDINMILIGNNHGML